MKSAKTMLGLASVFLTGALLAGEGEKQGGPRWPGLGKRPYMQREGQPGERLKKFAEENLPGAREEIARHAEVMNAIKEKARLLAEEIKAAVAAAGTPEAKREVGKSYEPKLRAIAAEIVDERLNHEQKMLDLRKANRDQAVEMTLKMIVGRALAKGEGMDREARPAPENLREKMRERREKRWGDNAGGDNAGGQQMPPSPEAQPGYNNTPPNAEHQPPMPKQAEDEQVIADELAAALEQALM